MAVSRAAVCRGVAAISDALNEIGAHERTDHDLAKHVVDAQADLEALMAYALAQLAEELPA